MIGIVITVSFVNYYLAIPAIVLSGIIYFVRSVYIKSARDIRRYEGVSKYFENNLFYLLNKFSVARSPVYTHITNTINGLASIRAFGAQESFEKQFYAYQNDHTSMWFLFIATSRAMGIAMEIICSLYILIISVVVMLSDGMHFVNFYLKTKIKLLGMEGGSAGLAISTGLMLTGTFQWAIR
mgnify:CR=1 FL=1